VETVTNNAIRRILLLLLLSCRERGRGGGGLTSLTPGSQVVVAAMSRVMRVDSTMWYVVRNIGKGKSSVDMTALLNMICTEKHHNHYSLLTDGGIT
jgi:hypothetical protein